MRVTDPWEASILVTWSVLTNQRPVFYTCLASSCRLSPSISLRISLEVGPGLSCLLTNEKRVLRQYWPMRGEYYLTTPGSSLAISVQVVGVSCKKYWPMRDENDEYWPIRGEYYQCWPMRGEYYLVLILVFSSRGGVGAGGKPPGQKLSWYDEIITRLSLSDRAGRA